MRVLIHRILLIKVDSSIRPKIKLPIIDTNRYTECRHNPFQHTPISWLGLNVMKRINEVSLTCNC